MARTLNNEVDVLNIASLDNDIKDSFTRAMITEDVNTTSAAARRYLEGEYFIHTDRYLYKALEDIEAGTIITPDVNAEVVTVSEELVRLFAQSPEGIFEILSNIENSSVASKNYVKGSQFIWTDKKLYEATANIVSGSTFVIGTNIKLADNLTSQIQTLANNVSTNASDITALATKVARCETLVVRVASFSTLPQTVTNANIEDDMVVVNSVLSSPAAQTGEWTVITSNGSLTISGSINRTTALTLYLMKSR